MCCRTPLANIEPLDYFVQSLPLIPHSEKYHYAWIIHRRLSVTLLASVPCTLHLGFMMQLDWSLKSLSQSMLFTIHWVKFSAFPHDPTSPSTITCANHLHPPKEFAAETVRPSTKTAILCGPPSSGIGWSRVNLAPVRDKRPQWEISHSSRKWQGREKM